MEKELYRYNPWWEGDFEKLTVLKERTDFKTRLLPNLANKQVVFLTGLRRIGKTSLMKLSIKHLLFQENISDIILHSSSFENGSKQQKVNHQRALLIIDDKNNLNAKGEISDILINSS